MCCIICKAVQKAEELLKARANANAKLWCVRADDKKKAEQEVILRSRNRFLAFVAVRVAAEREAVRVAYEIQWEEDEAIAIARDEEEKRAMDEQHQQRKQARDAERAKICAEMYFFNRLFILA